MIEDYINLIKEQIILGKEVFDIEGKCDCGYHGMCKFYEPIYEKATLSGANYCCPQCEEIINLRYLLENKYKKTMEE